MEERLLSLETRLAFLEQTIEELSRLSYKQQVAIDKQNYTIVQMHEKLRSFSEAQVRDLSEETPPPHY